MTAAGAARLPSLVEAFDALCPEVGDKWWIKDSLRATTWESLPSDGAPGRGLGLGREGWHGIATTLDDVGGLAALGAVIGRIDDWTMIAFRDVVVSAWRYQGSVSVRPVKRASPGDAGLDLDGLAALGGDRRLGADELRSRRAGADGDPAVAEFVARAEDLLRLDRGHRTPLEGIQFVGTFTMGGEGGIGDHPWRGIDDPVLDALRIAARMVPTGIGWERDGEGHEAFASGWKETIPYRWVATPPPPRSATLAAIPDDGPGRRTLAWMREAEVPARFVEGVAAVAAREAARVRTGTAA